MILSNQKNALLGGRPKGAVSKLTKLKEKAQQQMELTISKRTQKLVDAISHVALGTHKMVRLELDEIGMLHRRTVSDMTEMQNLLDSGEYGKDYLIIIGKGPDWKAGAELLNRNFGKATESVKHSGEVGFSLRGLAQARETLPVDNEDITDE